MSSTASLGPHSNMSSWQLCCLRIICHLMLYIFQLFVLLKMFVLLLCMCFFMRLVLKMKTWMNKHITVPVVSTVFWHCVPRGLLLPIEHIYDWLLNTFTETSHDCEEKLSSWWISLVPRFIIRREFEHVFFFFFLYNSCHSQPKHVMWDGLTRIHDFPCWSHHAQVTFLVCADDICHSYMSNKTHQLYTPIFSIN